MTGLPADEGVVLRALQARLTGVQVPLSDVLADRVVSVPVERVEATALLPYASLEQRSGDRALQIEPAGEQLRVRGSTRVLGRELVVIALSDLLLEDGQVVVRAQSYDVGTDLADAVVTRALRGLFDYEVPVPPLPYGLQVDGLVVRPAGVGVSASVDDAVLSTR